MSILQIFNKFIKICILVFILSFLYPVGYFVLDSNMQYKDSTTKTVNSKNKVGVYVINLERSKERYEYVKNNIMALGILVERISAVDGIVN